MAECQTDEERQAVARKIEAAITELQSILKNKGDAIAEAVKKQDDGSEMQQESSDGIDHAANICRATAEVNSALDDVLAYLKQRSACPTAYVPMPYSAHPTQNGSVCHHVRHRSCRAADSLHSKP